MSFSSTSSRLAWINNFLSAGLLVAYLGYDAFFCSPKGTLLCTQGGVLMVTAGLILCTAGIIGAAFDNKALRRILILGVGISGAIMAIAAFVFILNYRSAANAYMENLPMFFSLLLFLAAIVLLASPVIYLLDEREANDNLY